MVDWRGSSLQIVVALIGSSLILTALTSFGSFFNKPILEMTVKVKDSPYPEGTYDQYGNYTEIPSQSNSTTYKIFLENIGNSPAKDVRLTMTYPNATVSNVTPVYGNENLTFTNKTSDSSVVTLSRLSPGIKIEVENNITGQINDPYADAYNDFNTADFQGYTDYVYEHEEPFSINVAYDQGGSTYVPPNSDIYALPTYFNTDGLKFVIPMAVGLLLVGFAYRHKRKSLSKFASNVLEDIKAAERYLSVIDSRAILSFKNYDSNAEFLEQWFDNYLDYKLINDFYTGLKERASIISSIIKSGYLPTDDIFELKDLNANCLHLAKSAHENIDWKKFYKLDLFLLLPAVFLGSSIIFMISEGLPYFLIEVQFYFDIPYVNFAIYLITAVIARSAATYIVMRLILQAVHGRSINHTLPVWSRQKKFFSFSAAIMGFPTILIFVGIMYLIQSQTFDIIYDISTLIIFVVIDTCRMLLLAWVVSKYPWPRNWKIEILSMIKNYGRKVNLRK